MSVSSLGGGRRLLPEHIFDDNDDDTGAVGRRTRAGGVLA